MTSVGFFHYMSVLKDRRSGCEAEEFQSRCQLRGLTPSVGDAEINGDKSVSPVPRLFTDGGAGPAVPPPSPRWWADISAVEGKQSCLFYSDVKF